MNLPFVYLTISNILRIDVATIISLIWHINFAKIYTDSEVVVSMTLLFGRILSLVKKFH